jgi:CRISPR-associated endonuclease Csn1
MDRNGSPEYSRGANAPLIFGLDIGIASVGWAVLSDTRIVDLGVRAFDKAETAKDGESLNLARRTARLMRRRLWRRAWRLTKLARLLAHEGLVDGAGFFKSQPGFSDSTWTLRVAGLDRLLSTQEWARVIYHLCKHRGFHWVSKAEEKQAEGDSKGEGGKVKAGLAHTKALMTQKGYRTAAAMVLAEFPHAQRNKRGDYGKALSRVLLDEELSTLFEAQRKLGNPHASVRLEAAIRGQGGQRGGLFWEQRPIQSVLSMLGKCTFEKEEFRAPKASFTAERHVWLTRLNNLRINDGGTIRPLDAAERAVAITLPYQGGEKFTYKNLRTALVKAGLLSETFRFNGLSYPSARQTDEEKAKNPEDQVLVKLPAWHELRLTLKRAGFESEWLQLTTAALEGRPEMLDQIAWVLSVYKDDAEIRAGLQALALPGSDRTIDALLGVSFDKFHALSLKALRRIVPPMEQGLRYDEAVAQIPEYGHHSQRFVVGAGTHQYLPPLYAGRNKGGSMVFRDDLDMPRNPVVLRALNQARKVVNALVRSYGPPSAVHIEMARDLSRPLDERRDIEKLQREYRERNDQARDHFAELFKRRPNGAEFEKWLLYREQDGKCAYSLSALDMDRVVNDPTYVQVDHALPYSRSYDDSKNNKVVVLTRENQNKGNRTPYEYLDGTADSDRWRSFIAWVNGNKNYRFAKRSRLLRKNFGREEAGGFRDRNLNDTRYICKFFKNYVEQYLQLADGSEARRCVVLNGQLTAFLRARWGLLKIRAESDRHHALDAAVVAACSHAMVKRLADHARLKELEYLREGFADPESGEIINPAAHQKLVERFPEPCPKFRH